MPGHAAKEEEADAAVAPLASTKAKSSERGVVYLSRIPPHMGIPKLRSYMEQFGVVERIYLTPEDITVYKRRRRATGSKKSQYVDGWVEFAEKRIAKRVAITLNGEPIGGRKRHNFWRDDVWAIKYLPKFQWHHLSEHAVYNRTVRQEKLRLEFSQLQRENQFYLQQVDKRNRRMHTEKRKLQKLEAKNAFDGSSGEIPRVREMPDGSHNFAVDNTSDASNTSRFPIKETIPSLIACADNTFESVPSLSAHKGRPSSVKVKSKTKNSSKTIKSIKPSKKDQRYVKTSLGSPTNSMASLLSALAV